MTPQEKSVELWRLWQEKARTSNGAIQIPADAQVGKILEFCMLNVHEALRFVDLQLESDRNPLYDVQPLSDGYWDEVKRKLLELQVNNIIMAE